MRSNYAKIPTGAEFGNKIETVAIQQLLQLVGKIVFVIVGLGQDYDMQITELFKID